MSRERVIWSEGLFLRSQHLQQLERSIDDRIESRVAPLAAHGWGLTHVALQSEALARGRVALASARGVLPDGTPFAVPEWCPAPVPIEIAPAASDILVHLAVPSCRPGLPEFTFDADPGDRPIRYVAQDRAVADCVDGTAEAADMKVAALNLRLLAGDIGRHGQASIPIVRIAERRNDGSLRLDDSHIAPTLDYRCSTRLQGLALEVRQRVRQRADALAMRCRGAQARTGADLDALLTLQALNRFDAVLAHVDGRGRTHPEVLFGTLCALVGELSTFSETHLRRGRPASAYVHEDSRDGFEMLMRELRPLLAETAHPAAVQIALQHRAGGLHAGFIDDARLVRECVFIVAARSAQGDAQRLGQLSSQMKIGPADRIRDLVRLHLPAIALEPVGAHPRMPVLPGFHQFQLERGNDLWEQVARTCVLAIHVAGDFPDLELQLWAVRA